MIDQHGGGQLQGIGLTNRLPGPDQGGRVFERDLAASGMDRTE
jgi:hypothetical protein